jgi:hypothetical protein
MSVRSVAGMALICLACSGAAQSKTVPKGVVIPNAMASVFSEYQACLDAKTDASAVHDRATFKKAVEAGISACQIRRAELVAKSDAALRTDPAYSDPKKRAEVVAKAFDAQDEIQHAMGDGRVLYEDDGN